MQVQSLYLFGSGARESDFNGESDLDFLFEFKKDTDGMPLSGKNYFDLLITLENITGRKVDLIAKERLKNKYFVASITSDLIKLYEN